MKSFNKLLLLFAAGGFILASCNDDDDTSPEPGLPEITHFAVNGNADAEEGTHDPGETINFDIQATAEAGMAAFTITEDGNLIYDEDETAESITVNFEYTVPSSGSQYVLEFVVQDDNGSTDEVTYTVNLSREAEPIEFHQDLIIGAQHNDQRTGRVIDLTGGVVYDISDGEDNQASVDAAYFDHMNHVGTIAGTAHDFSENVYGFETDHGWTDLNNVTFKGTGMSVSEFEDIENDMPIFQAWNNEQYEERAYRGNLSTNNVIAFQTEDGTLGVFRVVHIEPGSEGFINLSIKVQE